MANKGEKKKLILNYLFCRRLTKYLSSVTDKFFEPKIKNKCSIKFLVYLSILVLLLKKMWSLFYFLILVLVNEKKNIAGC